MENIERLRKISKIKLIIMILATLLPLVILLVLEFIPDNKNSVLADLIVFRYGIFVAMECYIIFKIINYIKVLTNIDFAESEVLKRNDERNRFIRLKTNAMSIKIGLFIILIAMIISAFFSRSIFYTLLGVLTNEIVVYIFTSLYYIKKY